MRTRGRGQDDEDHADELPVVREPDEDQSIMLLGLGMARVPEKVAH